MSKVTDKEILNLWIIKRDRLKDRLELVRLTRDERFFINGRIFEIEKLIYLLGGK